MSRLLSSQALPLMLRSLRAKGVNPVPLLQERGLPLDADEGFELSLELNQAVELADACSAAAADPAFGLHVGHQSPRGVLGLIEFTVRTAPTIRDGLLALVQLSALLNGLVTLELDESSHFARLIHRVEGVPRCLGTQLNDFALAMLHRRALDITGEAFEVQRVQFAHGSPDQTGPYQQVFGLAELDFSMGANALVFSRHWLSRKPIEADPALSEVLLAQARQAVKERPRSDSLRAAVRTAMAKELEERSPELPDVAKRLAMSERTLQRKLTELDSSFHAELEMVRESLAHRYLRESDKTLAEISYLLRYSDPRAFARAFKRWTRLTPSEARARMTAPAESLSGQ